MLKSPGLLIEEKLVSAVSECSSNNNCWTTEKKSL